MEIDGQSRQARGTHVAAHHAFDDAGLKGLVDDASATRKIGFAACHEFGERGLGEPAVAIRRLLQLDVPVRQQADLPHALAAVAALPL